jgi:hypothetical protein
VLRQGRRRSRYWCERCGAVVTVATSELRAAPRPVPGDLAAVMPADMVRWLSDRVRRLPTVYELRRGTMYDLYRRWDAERASGLPAFSAVVDTLHDACYRTELAATRLGQRPWRAGTWAGSASQRCSGALRERVEHARRWLAVHAADLCWILRRLPDGELAVPDGEAVRAALTALKDGATLDADQSWAARAALFGTYAGPSLAALLDVYPREEMARALEVYLESGGRPLRANVLASLTAPAAGKSALS